MTNLNKSSEVGTKNKTSKLTWAVLFVIVVGAIVSENRSDKTNAANQQLVINQVSKSWHLVTKVDSDADANTPPFAMQGTEWRIMYSCYPKDKTVGQNEFSASIASTKGPYGQNFAIGINCPVSATPTYYYAEEPGQYYLKLGSPNIHYTVSVEDYY